MFNCKRNTLEGKTSKGLSEGWQHLDPRWKRQDGGFGLDRKTFALQPCTAGAQAEALQLLRERKLDKRSPESTFSVCTPGMVT